MYDILLYYTIGRDKMSKLAANLGYVDSLSSKKHRQINKESLPKEIQHKLKLIEKAFS